MTASDPQPIDGPEPAFDPRKRLGGVIAEKWTLDEVLGIGGMAVVYGATHRNGHRTAIKMLLPAIARDESLVRRFLREGYLANSVPHDGAVRVLDDGRTGDGSPFIVMERLFGVSLDVHTKNRAAAIDMRACLDTMIAVLEILEAAHGAGVVHRDIKPANIFRTTNGDVKLLDFGIAVLVESSSLPAASQSGSVIGTPAYMAPEQARGRADLVGPRSDLWAVAASGLAMMVGGRLRTAVTSMEELAMAALQPMPPAQTFGEALGGRFGDVLDRALAFEPGDRFANATEMREALEACRSEVIAVRLDSPIVKDTVPNAQTTVLPPVRRPEIAQTVVAPMSMPLATTSPAPTNPRSSRAPLVIAALLVTVAAATTAGIRMRNERPAATIVATPAFAASSVASNEPVAPPASIPILGPLTPPSATSSAAPSAPPRARATTGGARPRPTATASHRPDYMDER